MNVLVTYSSKTGNTKKLAEGIYEGLTGTGKELKKEILPMSEVKNLDAYDLILAGYWVDRGGANAEAAEFLKGIQGKNVGIFATLSYWPDSEHAFRAIKAGEDLVKENNHVIGRYICQGAIDPQLVEMFKKMPKDNPHYPSPEKCKLYDVSAHHPSAADIACAAELFRERITYDI